MKSEKKKNPLKTLLIVILLLLFAIPATCGIAGAVLVPSLKNKLVNLNHDEYKEYFPQIEKATRAYYKEHCNAPKLSPTHSEPPIGLVPISKSIRGEWANFGVSFPEKTAFLYEIRSTETSLSIIARSQTSNNTEPSERILKFDVAKNCELKTVLP